MKRNAAPKQMFSRMRMIVISLISLIIWGLLYFIGYFVAASIWFPVTVILITVIIYIKVTSLTRPAIGTVFAVITISLAVFSFFGNFEENYCWNKGVQADLTGSEMTDANPASDSRIFRDYRIGAGSKVGVAFIAHMRCHETFNLTAALKEKFLPIIGSK
jgi:hypothetical protein